MKNANKKILSMVLSICLIGTSMAVPTFAAEEKVSASSTVSLLAKSFYNEATEELEKLAVQWFIDAEKVEKVILRFAKNQIEGENFDYDAAKEKINDITYSYNNDLQNCYNSYIEKIDVKEKINFEEYYTDIQDEIKDYNTWLINMLNDMYELDEEYTAKLDNWFYTDLQSWNFDAENAKNNLFKILNDYKENYINLLNIEYAAHALSELKIEYIDILEDSGNEAIDIWSENFEDIVNDFEQIQFDSKEIFTEILAKKIKIEMDDKELPEAIDLDAAEVMTEFDEALTDKIDDWASKYDIIKESDIYNKALDIKENIISEYTEYADFVEALVDFASDWQDKINTWEKDYLNIENFNYDEAKKALDALVNDYKKDADEFCNEYETVINKFDEFSKVKEALISMPDYEYEKLNEKKEEKEEMSENDNQNDSKPAPTGSSANLAGLIGIAVAGLVVLNIKRKDK